MNNRPASGLSPSTIPHPRRILVRGVNWIGDAVMTTPALLRLRERFPDAVVALATPEKLADLWLRHPALNETIPFDPRKGPLAVSRKLRAFRADLALVFPNSPRSALEVWLAGVPRRLGYTRPWRNWFLTDAVSDRPGHLRMHKRPVDEIRRLVWGTGFTSPSSHSDESRARDEDRLRQSMMGHSMVHQIHDYLHLVGGLGAKASPLPTCLMVAPEEIDRVVDKFNLTAAVANRRLFLAVSPGAEYGPAKRWPVERFAAATVEIRKRTNCIWLILGGPGDVELAGRIELALRGADSELRNLAGQTSVRELCALLKFSGALLTNDTGAMHVAAALGTPVVAPFGSTSPDLTGPALPGDPRHRLLRSDAPCSPCFRRECPIDLRCLTGISMERVVEAVVESLNR
jgi:heptosyltransferase-2